MPGSLARIQPTGRNPRSSVPNPTELPQRDDPRWAAIVALAFCAVVGSGLIFHEIWRDEWQAWMIARDSASLQDLFANLRYEGHPSGWYLLLFALSRFTRDVIAMRILSLAVATGAVYLFVRFAPLPRLYRTLTVFGYFFVFEYGVISRSYSLGLLALFAFCTIYPARWRHPIALSLTLALLANTSVYGGIIALAAVAALSAEAVSEWVRNHRVVWSWSAAVGFIIFVASLVIAVVQTVPPADAHFTGTPSNTIPGLARQDLLQVVKIWGSYVPIPDLTEEIRWNSQLVPRGDGVGMLPLLALSASVLVASMLLFVRKPFVLALYCVGTLALLTFSHSFHAGVLRHNGHLYLLFLACLWLAAVPSPQLRLPDWVPAWTAPTARPARAFVLFVLTAQVVAGSIFLAIDILRPFSPAAAVADYLRANDLDGLPIAVSHSAEASPISGDLDRPLFHLGSGKEWTFIPWGEPLGRIQSEAQTVERARTFMEAAGSDVVVIASYRVDEWDNDLRVLEHRYFGPGLAPDETYYVYRVVADTVPTPTVEGPN